MCSMTTVNGIHTGYGGLDWTCMQYSKDLSAVVDYESHRLS